MTKTPLVHLLVGRESTYCGRGEASPAFTTRERAQVTCPRCAKSKPCECADRACPAHVGADCTAPALVKLRRTDMHGARVAFCASCASDALDSGVFA